MRIPQCCCGNIRSFWDNKKLSQFRRLMEKIKQDMASQEFCNLKVPCPQDRKAIHEYCEQQGGWSHVGYCDTKTESTKISRYWCKTCKDWKLDSGSKTSYCCVDEDGLQACSDWAILCLKCNAVIWTQDAHEDPCYKRKQTMLNNAILIFCGNPYSEKNRALIKSTGMRTRTFRRKIREHLAAK